MAVLKTGLVSSEIDGRGQQRLRVTPPPEEIHTEVFVDKMTHFVHKQKAFKKLSSAPAKDIKRTGWVKKVGGKEGWEEARGEEIQYLKKASFVCMHILPSQACSPGHSGFLDHSACCEKGQGRKVSNTPSDAECLPRSLSGCGPSGACSGLADRLEGEVSRSEQQKYKVPLGPPPRESGGPSGIRTLVGQLTEVFNGLDVIVAQVKSIQFL